DRKTSGKAGRPERAEDERDEQQRGGGEREVDGHLVRARNTAEARAELRVRGLCRARRLGVEELAARPLRDRAERGRVGLERLAEPGAPSAEDGASEVE